eukprot:3504617-Amphidinium_carterae.1
MSTNIKAPNAYACGTRLPYTQCMSHRGLSDTLKEDASMTRLSAFGKVTNPASAVPLWLNTLRALDNIHAAASMEETKMILVDANTRMTTTSMGQLSATKWLGHSDDGPCWNYAMR